MTITVTRIDDRLIAVKRAEASDPGRRRREAELLARLDHPGLVPYVDFVDGDPPELHTAYVGTDTWARTPPATDREIVEGLATLASTVADLHDLGLAHRSLVADHVVVSGSRRPVICGLADATPFDPVGEADDLAALGDLIRHLAPGATTELRDALLGLADEASTGSLTARTLTDRLDDMPTASGSLGRRRVRLPRHPVAAAFTVAVAVGGISLISAIGANDPTTADPASAPLVASASSTTLSSTSTSTSTSTSSTAPATTTAEATPVPGPTQPPEAAIEFVHEGRRYGLGDPTDIAVLGDWNCDGTKTPALLQSATGLVAVFATWPAADEAATATATSLAPEAVGLEAVEDLDCHELRILEPGGSRLFTTETP
ncbi:MAG: hypothetical protein RIB98_16275 [Acidimicrobiales bacterium]